MRSDRYILLLTIYYPQGKNGEKVHKNIEKR